MVTMVEHAVNNMFKHMFYSNIWFQNHTKPPTVQIRVSKLEEQLKEGCFR